MEESRNGSDTENANLAREILGGIDAYLEELDDTWQGFVPSHDEAPSRENEGAVQQHMISSVTFRLFERQSRRVLELENVWDNVYIRQLDDIGQKPNCEWLLPSYSDDNIQSSMAENANVVLVRIIFDWSREDGNVFSKQVVWSGSFRDGHGVLQLLEEDSIQLRVQEFDVHPHLRERFIPLHRTFHVAAAMAATYMCPIVVIPDDGDILMCAICHDELSTGYDPTELPCNHVFHRDCILKWFYVKLECPLCREEV